MNKPQTNDILVERGGDALHGTVKTTVARLQPKEEVLLLGWGVPMLFACPQGSRKYDDAFWKELLGGKGKRSDAEINKEMGY